MPSRPGRAARAEVADTVRALGEGVAGFEIGEPLSPCRLTAARGLCLDLRQRRGVRHIDEGRRSGPRAGRRRGAERGNGAPRSDADRPHAQRRAGLGPWGPRRPGRRLPRHRTPARRLRVVGTVRASDLGAGRQTKLPYDEIIDSAELPARLAGKRFDIVIDPVGGSVRTASVGLLAPMGRLLPVGNASGDWNHQIDSNRIWLGNLAVHGFSVGFFLPRHKDLARPALQLRSVPRPPASPRPTSRRFPSPTRQWRMHGWSTTR